MRVILITTLARERMSARRKERERMKERKRESEYKG